MPCDAEPLSQGAGPRRRAVSPSCLSGSLPQFPLVVRLLRSPREGLALFWKEREHDCVALTLLSLGAQGWAWVRRVWHGSRWVPTGLSRASGLRPLLLHELTHAGISTFSPDYALVRCFRRDALSLRSPAWRDASAAFAVRLQLGSPLPHPLIPPRILRQGPLRDREESPHSTWRCGGSERAAVSGERSRGPSGLECGYRAFHGQIRRPRLWPQGGGGSCCLMGVGGCCHQTSGRSSLLCCCLGLG